MNASIFPSGDSVGVTAESVKFVSGDVVHSRGWTFPGPETKTHGRRDGRNHHDCSPGRGHPFPARRCWRGRDLPLVPWAARRATTISRIDW